MDASTIISSTFVRHVELHDKLPSTNDRAIELAASPDLETPALVVARLQTAGRGRGRNTWWSAEGALTFSLVLDTEQWNITQRDWPRLSLATAVAVCDTIEITVAESRHAPSPLSPAAYSIKWPNDVLVDGRKVCGILIESPARAAVTRDRLVVGIGVNVNNSWREAPTEIRADGIALCDIAGGAFDLQPFLIELLNCLDARCQQLADDGAELALEWQRRSWLTHRRVAVKADSRCTEGLCVGIDGQGALLVKTASGIERHFGGTVAVLP